MTTSAEVKAYEVRPFAAADEGPVLELLVHALGGGPGGARPPEFFRWKHYDNPFGRSFMLVAESQGRIVGFRSFMRWRFVSSHGEVTAVQAVDTATQTDFRRMGIFSRLTLGALEELRATTDLVYNTPNHNSRPGYLKMGWSVVARVPVWIKPRRPLRVARHSLARTRPAEPGSEVPPVAAERAAAVLDGNDELSDLLERAHLPTAALMTPRSIDFLKWRYADAPLLDYRAVAVERRGRLAGIAVFRVRPRGALQEATVAELITAPGDSGTARALVSEITRTARVDVLTGLFGQGLASARQGLASGFIRAPRGVVLVVNQLNPVSPDPLSLSSWRLSVGDLEVF